MNLKSAMGLIQKLKATGQGVSISINIEIDDEKEPVTKKEPAASQETKSTSTGTGRGRGRTRSKESIQREKYIRALHEKRSTKLTRVQAAEMVAEKFGVTIDKAKTAVYAIKDLDWKKSTRGNPNLNKETSSRRSEKRVEAEEDFMKDLDGDEGEAEADDTADEADTGDEGEEADTDNDDLDLDDFEID